MQQSLAIHRISIYVLIGIAILASFALVAELLPEVKAKMIVIPTLVYDYWMDHIFHNFIG